MFKKSYFQRLDLSFNHLENLDPHLLMSSYNLETLDLSHNQLTSFNLKSANYFRWMEILNLAYNHLTQIEEDWQLGYLNLRDLNVSHNRIGPTIHKRWSDLVLFHFDLVCFRDLQFSKQHYGMFLDLSYNRIEVVDILPARRVQDGGPMWQTINLEIKGGSNYCNNNNISVA